MSRQSKSEFIKWMGPVLDALRRLGGSGTPKEVATDIVEFEHISEEKLNAITSSGTKRFYNQVCWSRQYLVWEGYIENSKRGTWILSSTGANMHITQEEARKIFIKWVNNYSEKRKMNKSSSINVFEQEEIEENEQSLPSYSEELIDILRKLSPRGFEELCLLLLREHGFDNLKLTPAGPDGGIDGSGIVRIKSVVSLKVLFQCKRYNEKHPVRREQIGDFCNAVRTRADKGIFITTGYFSPDSIKEANREGLGGPQIELIDCDKLIEMFETAELGLTPIKAYEIDKKFFQKYKDDQN